ncbi:MAG: hypothetical protein SWY16_10650 [Cyanobacteriota bacterium]|nr:hypothetical protein [Cyanobacteriota bacterium]
MLHLAQVSKKGILGKTVLRLLAHERIDKSWVIPEEEDFIDAPEANSYSDGVLVLVDIHPNRQIISLKEATDWVMKLVSQYLGEGITPSFLKQESHRVEQWRQSLTLQSQDLARRLVELETRREQIQALEDKLKREKRMLQSIKAQLQRQRKST